MKLTTLFKVGAVALSIHTAAAWASGAVPETSVVIIEQADGEGAINVRNTDADPSLLLTTLHNVQGDNITSMLTVTPPAARVEPGKNQRVRFILTDKTPLKTEHLGRVIFEGVLPQKKGENLVRMNVRQNLPVLVRPANLPRDMEPWKRLNWKQSGSTLTVSNSSAYVVRLGQAVKTLPDNAVWMLPNGYVLPGQTVTLRAEKNSATASATRVRISPATTWGYTVADFDAPVTR